MPLLRVFCGDESHYLLKCNHSSKSFSLLSSIFLKRPFSININFMNTSCKALFLYILTMCDEIFINLRVAYVDDLLNCDKSESLCSSVSQVA